MIKTIRKTLIIAATAALLVSAIGPSGLTVGPVPDAVSSATTKPMQPSPSPTPSPTPKTTPSPSPSPMPTPSPTPAGIAAQPTSSTVFINGKQVSFRAYNIKDNNYFKLRDLAKALSGSDKQFEIAYAAAGNAISITTGKAYTPAGGELTDAGDTAVRTALVSNATVTVNGVKVALSAYMIDGYNYYKLRDIAAAVGFTVSFNSTSNSIQIGTGNEDTAEEEETEDDADAPPAGT